MGTKNEYRESFARFEQTAKRTRGNDFTRKSAEAGCSCGMVDFAHCFWKLDYFVKNDEQLHVQWLERIVAMVGALAESPRRVDYETFETGGSLFC